MVGVSVSVCCHVGVLSKVLWGVADLVVFLYGHVGEVDEGVVELAHISRVLDVTQPSEAMAVLVNTQRTEGDTQTIESEGRPLLRPLAGESRGAGCDHDQRARQHGLCLLCGCAEGL